MDLSTFNPYLLAGLGWVLGIVAAVVGQRVLSKRGVLAYTVRHDRVGLSGADAIFGSVEVLWNGNPVNSLYATTVELVNDSAKDFESIGVVIFTGDTTLLSERRELVGTTKMPEWNDAYVAQLAVPTGQLPTQVQVDTYAHRREYVIPTMNRGQVARFAYLTTAPAESGPHVWMDVVHPGVKLRYRVPHTEVFGVPQPHAAFAGFFIGVAAVTTIIITVDALWLAAVLSLALGFVAQLPGAYTVRAWRKLRAVLTD